MVGVLSDKCHMWAFNKHDLFLCLESKTSAASQLKLLRPTVCVHKSRGTRKGAMPEHYVQF